VKKAADRYAGTTTVSQPGDILMAVAGLPTTLVMDRPFPFLDLPPELRIMIYEYHLSAGLSIEDGTIRSRSALSAVCRQVKNEMKGYTTDELAPVIAEKIVFNIHDFDFTPAIAYISRLSQRNRTAVAENNKISFRLTMTRDSNAAAKRQEQTRWHLVTWLHQMCANSKSWRTAVLPGLYTYHKLRWSASFHRYIFRSGGVVQSVGAVQDLALLEAGYLDAQQKAVRRARRRCIICRHCSWIILVVLLATIGSLLLQSLLARNKMPAGTGQIGG
jgi:hypothetical protein